MANTSGKRRLRMQKNTGIHKPADMVLDSTSMDLLKAGVSREALHTTLEREDRQDLRTFILDELYLDDSGEVRWVYFYPAQSRSRKQLLSNVQHCDLIFNLFFKECRLHGLGVGEFPINTMYQEYDSERCFLYNDEDTPMARFSPLIFVPDFYPEQRDGPRYPMVDSHEAFSRYMQYRTSLDNVGFVLQGVVPPVDVTNWWSPKTMGYINYRAILQEIHGPEVQ